MHTIGLRLDLLNSHADDWQKFSPAVSLLLQDVKNAVVLLLAPPGPRTGQAARVYRIQFPIPQEQIANGVSATANLIDHQMLLMMMMVMVVDDVADVDDVDDKKTATHLSARPELART